jgi:hypothetical protein
VKSFPGIRRAALEIAYDNGCINRFQSETKALRKVDRFISGQPLDLIEQMDVWLSGLSDEEISDACCGGDGEPERLAVMAGAPPFADGILDDIFEAL